MSRDSILILLLILATASISWGADTGEQPPLTVASTLFDPAAGETLGLREAPGAETFTIYHATDATNKFVNHPQLVWFKGHYYATWQTTPKDEDSDDSTAVYSRSTDGKIWSDPVVIAPALKGGIYHASGGWWTDGQTLVCLIIRLDVSAPGRAKATEVRTSTDGEHWSEQRILIPDAAASASPQALTDGRLVLVGHGPSEDATTLISKIYYTDAPDGLNGWTLAQRPVLPERNIWESKTGDVRRCLAREIEPSMYAKSDGALVMLFRDVNFEAKKRSHRVLAATSIDRAQTWSLASLTDMPDSDSMQCAGNLPDGTAYMVNCPVRTFRRAPLAITLSNDGNHFDRSFLVRGAPPPRRYEGTSKTLGYSYPGAMVHGDHLWIAYATNKEDVEVTRIPLAALMVGRR